MEQATAAGGDVLVVAGAKARDVAEHVVASTEPLRRGEALGAPHTSCAPCHAAAVLLKQMRWTRRGADLLLQVRRAVHNGALGTGFGQRFQAANDPHPPVVIAA